MEHQELLRQMEQMRSRRPWWARLFSFLMNRLRRPRQLEAPKSFDFSEAADTEPQEWTRRESVAQTIESAMSATTWFHVSQLGDPESIVIRNRVMAVDVRSINDVDWWLYVTVTNNQGLHKALPLHEFLHQFMPFDDLTFSDYDA